MSIFFPATMCAVCVHEGEDEEGGGEKKRRDPRIFSWRWRGNNLVEGLLVAPVVALEVNVSAEARHGATLLARRTARGVIG